jgi:peptidoglycan/xylan/chitin deacetylase (PgdA/CDA1 family)
MGTSRQTGQAARLGGKRPALARACAALGLMPLFQAARGTLRDDLRILAYHRVLDIDDAAFSFDLDLVSASSAQFRSQMEHVRRRYHPMRFHDVLECIAQGRRLPKNAAIVTFDDGYDDNYRVAFPILRSLGVPATFFVSTGHIDSGRAYAYDWLVHMICVTPAREVDLPEFDLKLALPPDRRARAAIAADLLDRLKWLDDDGQGALVARLEREWSMPRAQDADCRPMTWAQLREMHAAGMEIGSHGVHHRMLARLRHDDMVGEVAESRAALERELGVAPAVLSYPVGGNNAYSDEVIAALKAHGFTIGCTYISGSNRLPLADPYTLRRLPVERYTDQAWFCGTLAWPELFSHRSRQRS